MLAQLPSADPNYELVFEDNFDGSSVDTSKWNSSYPWNQTGYIDVSDCNNIPSDYLRQIIMDIEKGTLKIVS